MCFKCASVTSHAYKQVLVIFIYMFLRLTLLCVTFSLRPSVLVVETLNLLEKSLKYPIKARKKIYLHLPR